jgi:phospholipid/cholesterol/gamma-HCH transport system ATP-binding protein
MGNGDTTRLETSSEYLIRLEHVYKQFGEHVVFRDFSMGFRRGETTVVLGASGVGKSVLLKLILGLLKPTSGRIFVDGADITRLSERNLVPVRKRFGMLFQGAALFDFLTVYENVSFALHEHKTLPEAEMRRIAAQKLALVDMAGTEDLLPEELSGGMRKRVGLARAIAMEPEVILYDEPTTGLDPVTADTINDLILRCQRELKTTGIVVTHDMASAYKVGDRMILLYEGAIIADGTPDEIRRHPDIRVQRFIHGDASLTAAPPAS